MLVLEDDLTALTGGVFEAFLGMAAEPAVPDPNATGPFYTSSVAISGGWDGSVSIIIPVPLARAAAAAMFGMGVRHRAGAGAGTRGQRGFGRADLPILLHRAALDRGADDLQVAAPTLRPWQSGNEEQQCQRRHPESGDAVQVDLAITCP